MPSHIDEKVPARQQFIQKREVLDAPNGPLAQVPVEGHENHGLPKIPGQPRRDDAQNAPMPPIRSEREHTPFLPSQFLDGQGPCFPVDTGLYRPSLVVSILQDL